MSQQTTHDTTPEHAAGPGPDAPVPAPGATRRRVLTTGSVAVLGVLGLAACGGEDEPATPAAPGGGEGSAAPSAAGGGTGSSGATVVPLAEVPVGGAVTATAGGKDILVAQPTAGQVVAFSSVCPHQGCKVAPVGSQFECPCHQSRFAFADGAVTKGPATKGLTTVDVSVQGADVVLG
jgi:Rieske Fe-S protein